jgi:hypothetical protein
MKIILLVLALFPALANAAASEDEAMGNSNACMVAVDDANSYKQINVNYIRLLKINKSEPNVVQLSMASNYYNGDTDKFLIKYNSSQEARKFADELASQITNCRKKK